MRDPLSSAVLQDKANRLHAAATRKATHKIDEETYTLEFTQGVYEVTDAAGEYVVRFNTRKITEAKRWLREYVGM